MPTTLAGHAYWRTPDAAQRRLQKAAFDKNVSIMGGLLIAAAARR